MVSLSLSFHIFLHSSFFQPLESNCNNLFPISHIHFNLHTKFCENVQTENVQRQMAPTAVTATAKTTTTTATKVIHQSIWKLNCNETHTTPERRAIRVEIDLVGGHVTIYRFVLPTLSKNCTTINTPTHARTHTHSNVQCRVILYGCNHKNRSLSTTIFNHVDRYHDKISVY